MSLTMLKNFVGLPVTDEEMRDIPNPRLELSIHVTYKTVQACSVLGLLVVAPIVTGIRGPRNTKALKSRMFKYCGNGLLVGLPLGPVAAMAVGGKDKPEKNYDRCYRIRHNTGQLRVDKLSTIGGVLGLCTAGAVGVTQLQGVALGVVCGVISHVALKLFV